jgi:hypothetical protein
MSVLTFARNIVDGVPIRVFEVRALEGRGWMAEGASMQPKTQVALVEGAAERAAWGMGWGAATDTTAGPFPRPSRRPLRPPQPPPPQGPGGSELARDFTFIGDITAGVVAALDAAAPSNSSRQVCRAAPGAASLRTATAWPRAPAARPPPARHRARAALLRPTLPRSRPTASCSTWATRAPPP